MIKSTQLIASLTVLMILNGCVIVKHSANVEHVTVESTKLFSAELEQDAVVYLDLPSGEINIYESGEGKTFTAQLSRSCPVNNLTKCKQDLEDIEFISKQKNGRYKISTNSSFFKVDTALKLEIYVPDIQHLNLEATAGDIYVSPLRSCFTADITAGDLTIEAYSSEVESVSLYATAGETSLRINENNIPEERFLSRSKTSWSGGEGKCALKAEISAGEVSVNVVPG